MGAKEEQKSNLGFRSVAVDTTAGGKAIANPPGGSAFALIRNEGASDVRWRDDGVNPDAATGVLLKSGEVLSYDGQVEKLKFICAGAGSAATVTASVYG